jgi:beta-xylosidase
MKKIFTISLALLSISLILSAQNQQGTIRQQVRRPDQNGIVNLDSLRWRDMCVLADPVSKNYYIVGPGGRSVRCYTSKDLINWEGPRMIYTAPQDVWGDIPIISIWAPELHYYKGKYYLFLTFDTRNRFSEQWRNWERNGRVTRGTTILVSDSPAGPYSAFKKSSTLPSDMMTLDGTLWVEDGVPYMVYCHEWVQVTDGAVGYVKLKDDLSDTDGEPVNLFRGSQASWKENADTAFTE